jgi:DNA-binding XRE family transcriptional regulator
MHGVAIHGHRDAARCPENAEKPIGGEIYGHTIAAKSAARRIHGHHFASSRALFACNEPENAPRAHDVGIHGHRDPAKGRENGKSPADREIHGHDIVIALHDVVIHGHDRGIEGIAMTRRTGFDREAARFGEIIRRMRLSKGWTLAQLGRRADMSPAYLACLERGENTPSLSCVLHLSRVFAVEAWTIVAEVEGVA